MHPFFSASLTLLCCTALRAQTAAPPPGNATQDSGTNPVVANQPETVVRLNPFEVQSDSDRSYGALNSNSITRFDAELDKLPITADIFTDAFIKDTASSSVEQMVQTYSAGAGFTTGDPGSSAATSQPLDRNGNSGITLRGLSNTQEQRDGFLPVSNSTGVGFTSTFDIERVEVINGPQALLYGTGGGGGVMNLVSKQARLGTPASAISTFQVDQYGNRMGQFDVAAGTDRVAARVVLLNQTVGGRRLDIGGPAEGYYVQVAAKLFGATTLRLTGEQTTFSRINSSNLTLAALSTSNDARNGDYLHYLLATNQVQTAANGAPSGAGPIDNGLLNWGNVDSYGGWYASEMTVNEWEELTAETEWAQGLSTQLTAGYINHTQDRVNSPPTFTAPNVAANTLPGQWAAGLTSAFPINDTEEPGRTKAIRFSALATDDWFGGKAHSQTVLGADYNRGDGAQITYSYFQADSNFNVIVNPAGTNNLGRTPLPKLYWPIGNGPLAYPYFTPSTPQFNLGGVNYVHMIENVPAPSLVSANDPLGVGLGAQGYLVSDNVQSGLYGVNFTQWLDGKLETLSGFRLARSFEQTQNQGSAPPLPANATQASESHSLSFDAGADYALRSWLRPYFSVSDSYDPPTTQLQDPYGQNPQTAHALGEEVGLKLQSAGGMFSGSVALYHIDSKNEEDEISATLENDINPTGLNGRFSSPSNWINVAREAEGLQAILTAAPTPDWRLRLSAAVVNGKIGTTTGYGQLYNDQFNANPQGQVTYADGTIVYVNPTFNSKQLTVTSATAGAIPLTVAALGTPSSVYYANPQPLTGQILSSTNVAKVLEVVDPVHGAILTGRTGLPISDLQVNPVPSGISIPGAIVTSQSGDATTGYPELSLVFTSVYTLPTGPLKGLQFGGNFLGGWYNRSYYYYPAGVVPGSKRILFDDPTMTEVDLILGYRRKFHRVTFHSQLNVSNLFNHYDVILLPNEVSGWSTPVGINATFTQQPRSYVWTNTLQF